MQSMSRQELELLVMNEIAKALMTGENINECEENIIESLKITELDDDQKAKAVSSAVALLWNEWPEEGE